MHPGVLPGRPRCPTPCPQGTPKCTPARAPRTPRAPPGHPKAPQIHAGVELGCPAGMLGCPWARKSERVLRKSMVFAKNVDSCTKVNGFHGKATEPWALCMVTTYSGKRSAAFNGVQRRSTAFNGDQGSEPMPPTRVLSIFLCFFREERKESLSSIYTPSGQRPRRTFHARFPKWFH